MTKHKWHKEIKAWADGAEIEVKHLGGWSKWNELDMWFDNCEYRIKPQPKEPQYLYVYKLNNEIRLWDSKTPAQNYIGKIKLEVEE